MFGGAPNSITMSKKATEQSQKIADRRKHVEMRMKKFGMGKTSLVVGGEHENYQFIPIGIPEIDAELKTELLDGSIHNGLLRGTIIEFCGPSQSAKTYTAYHFAKEHQAKGLRVLFIDAERGYYEPRAVQLGVNIEDSDLWELVKVSVSAETIGDYLVECVNSGEYGLIILDSIATLVPDADFEKSLEDNAKVGAHAQFMGRLLKKLASSKMEENLTTVVLINQFRAGAGAMPNTMVDKSTGGKAVEYWTRIRLWFSRINGKAGMVLDSDNNVIGGKSRCLIQKTKTGGQDKTAIFNVFFVPADNDVVGEFLFTACNHKDFEGLLTYTTPRGEKQKHFRYVDPDTGEVLTTPDKYEFCRMVQVSGPPEKRPRTDKSETMFDYMLARLKYTETQKQTLLATIANPPMETAAAVDDSETADGSEA